MIKLRVNGELLDMQQDTKLNIKTASPIFETEIIRGEFTEPFTIPLTVNNSRILGFPEQITAQFESFVVTAELERLGTIAKGLLYIDSINYNLLYGSGVAECTFAGQDGRLFKLIDGRKLWQVDLGSPFAIPTYAPYASNGAHSNVTLYASDVTNGVITGVPFCFPMIKWEDSGMLLPGGYVNNWQNVRSFAFQPGNQYAFVWTSPVFDDGNDARAAIVPMFFTKWVLLKIFDEIGFSLTSDLLSLPEFEADFMVSNFVLNKWVLDQATPPIFPNENDDCSEIIPADHMPDVYIADFLNAICKRFCGQFLPTGPTSYEFVFKKDIILTDSIIEIPNPAISPDIKKKTGETITAQRGLNLNYNNGDSAFERVVPTDLALNRITGTVATVAALSGISSPPDGAVYLVTSENNFYNYYAGTAQWFFMGANYIPNTIYADGNDISIEAAPPPNERVSFHFNSFSGGPGVYQINAPVMSGQMRYFAHRPINVPGSSTAVYTNLETNLTTRMGMRFLMWFGLLQNEAGDYAIPYSSGYNYDDTASHNKVFDYNLSLYGAEGLYNTFYKDWDLALTKSTKYELQIYLAEHEVNDLDFKSLIYALNQKFLLYNRSFNEPYQDVAVLEIYKLAYQG